MNKESTYWKWKSLIIDFATLSDEKNNYGGYISKKDMVFTYLGTPDDEIHEWYNGKYSSEYNEAYRYGYELGLIEEYIDYEDKIDQLTNNWNELEEWLKDMKTPKQNNWGDYGYTWALKIDVILDKMKEISDSNNEPK